MVRRPTVGKPGFPTTGGCWLFDEIEGDVSSVVPHADNSTSPHHTPPATLSPPLTRIVCWSPSAPPSLTTRPPWSARCNMLDAARRAFITVGPGGVGWSVS